FLYPVKQDPSASGQYDLNRAIVDHHTDDLRDPVTADVLIPGHVLRAGGVGVVQLFVRNAQPVQVSSYPNCSTHGLPPFLVCPFSAMADRKCVAAYLLSRSGSQLGPNQLSRDDPRLLGLGTALDVEKAHSGSLPESVAIHVP